MAKEIPKKDKEKIKEIVQLNTSNPTWKGVDWEYLLTIYYKHTRIPSRLDSLKYAVANAMTCGGCKSQCREYFKTHSQNW